MMRKNMIVVMVLVGGHLLFGAVLRQSSSFILRAVMLMRRWAVGVLELLLGGRDNYKLIIVK